MPTEVQPDWGQLEKDVIRKLRLLRIAWEHTAKTPEIHEKFRKDLYVPVIEHLARFCVAVDDDVESVAEKQQ